jgi:BirA family biotin operon repressor/biotin-[acetyl-CoA-carboxylase] ligase
MLMSVLLRPSASIASVVPLLAGLAVTDGAAAVIDGVAGGSGGDAGTLALKWPNDVLVPALAERKLSGILAEATTTPELAVVVGMGLNLRWGTPPPAEVAARAATLEEAAGGPVERWEVVRNVLEALDAWLATAERDGSGPVLAAYRRRCCTIGRLVRLERPTDVVEGTATGIADDGALIVETTGGTISVTAGDAHHIG